MGQANATWESGQVNRGGIIWNSTDNFLLGYAIGLDSVSANKAEFIGSNPRPEDILELEGRKSFCHGNSLPEVKWMEHR